MKTGTLRLTQNRFTIMAFSALVVIQLVVLVWAIALLFSTPAQAGTCGIFMTYQYTCKMQVNASGIFCGPGNTLTKWTGYSTRYQAWEAPHSYESLSMNPASWCARDKPSPNCPSFCQH